MLINKVLMAVVAVAITFSVHAKDTLQFSNAWIPEAPPVVKVMAGYIKIHNPTSIDIVINKVTSPDFEKVEMHQTIEKDGMSRMVKQDKMMIPAGGTVLFQRGGRHLMLINPKRVLKRGEKVSLKFSTRNDGASAKTNINISAEIKEAAIEDHSHHHHH